MDEPAMAHAYRFKRRMRQCAGNAISLGIAGLFAGAAAGQNYPQKPLRMIVPSSPGGGSDIMGRFLAQKLAEQLGQHVVVENRPGASSMLGTDAAAKSAPDGYTLVIPPAAVSVNPSIFARMPYDTRRDLAAISQVAESANVLVAHPALPVRTIQDLIALAKAKPGTLSAASPGISGTPHMAAELFKLMTGTDLLIIVYKGSGPGSIAVMSGEVPLQFSTPPSSMPYVRAGRMRAMGVTTKSRAPSMPEVPTITESGVPGYEATQWFGLFSAGGTPSAIVDRLAQETARAVRSPDLKDKMSAEGLQPVGNTPTEFSAYLRAEMAKWAKVVKAANIKPQQ
jgi:tripartite-type tricarboxylate transporter receptor subunit TctC